MNEIVCSGTMMMLPKCFGVEQAAVVVQTWQVLLFLGSSYNIKEGDCAKIMLR
jgi:hypothetical protein